jgi:isopenicillin N synthase-like dioxygenase
MEVLKISYTDPEAPTKLVKSLRETGFAVITDHTIQASLITDAYKEWHEFFASREKFNSLFSPETQTGYFPFKSENAKDNEKKDLKEFFHLYNNTGLPQGITAPTLILKDSLESIATNLLTWLQMHLPDDVVRELSTPLPQMIKNSNKTLLRILHYPPLDGSEDGAVRAAAHGDINLITLLPAATTPGLQAQDVNGNWHSIPCDTGDIIVNAGDMLELATGGYFKSTTHRVINPTGDEAKKSRYSMPLFLHPRPEIYLGHGQTAEQYLNQRLAEIGLKEEG